MLIYNLQALPAVALALIVYYIINRFWPGLFNGAFGDYLVALNVFLCGALTEIAGLKGRIFFVPVWACGVLYGYFHLTAPMKGWAWLPLIGCLALLVVWAEVRFLKRQREAPERLRLAQISFREGKADEMWTLLTDSYLTSTYHISREVGTHDQNLIRFLRSDLNAQLTEKQRAFLAGYAGQLEWAELNDYRSIKIERKIETCFQEFLESKGTADPPDEILTLALTPPEAMKKSG